MICPKCDQDYERTCECGYTPKQTTRLPLWIIQHCTRAGCQSAIRSRHGLCESELVCKWCRATEDQGCPFAVYPSHVTHAQADG